MVELTAPTYRNEFCLSATAALLLTDWPPLHFPHPCRFLLRGVASTRKAPWMGASLWAYVLNATGFLSHCRRNHITMMALNWTTYIGVTSLGGSSAIISSSDAQKAPVTISLEAALINSHALTFPFRSRAVGIIESLNNRTASSSFPFLGRPSERPRHLSWPSPSAPSVGRKGRGQHEI